MIDNKNFNGACRKAPFLFAFCKTIGSFTCLAAKMARIFRVKTAKRIGIFSKYLQNWQE